MAQRSRRSGGRQRQRVSPARKLLMQKKRPCPLAARGIREVDYLDVELLRGFVGDDYKIVPSRISGTSAKMQRSLALAVKRARYLGLLPYTDQHASGNHP